MVNFFPIDRPSALEICEFMIASKYLEVDYLTGN